jgi:hypothetical protein
MVVRFRAKAARRNQKGRGKLMSIREHTKFAARKPQVLKVIGEESESKGTSSLTARQIDQVIKESRRAKGHERGQGVAPSSAPVR